MSNYYYIWPEVPGTGPPSYTDESEIDVLQFEFDGWLGDDLLNSTEWYLASDGLADRLTSSELTGYEIADAAVTKSDKFERIHPDRELPEFHWFKVHGEPGADDFGIGDVYADDVDGPVELLVISEPALEVLKEGTLNHAEIGSYEGRDG